VQPDEAVAGLVRGCETKPQEWPCSLSRGSMSKGRLTLPQPDGNRKRRRLVVRASGHEKIRVCGQLAPGSRP
jgi:hypothetical protein